MNISLSQIARDVVLGSLNEAANVFADSDRPRELIGRGTEMMALFGHLVDLRAGEAASLTNQESALLIDCVKFILSKVDRDEYGTRLGVEWEVGNAILTWLDHLRSEGRRQPGPR